MLLLGCSPWQPQDVPCPGALGIDCGQQSHQQDRVLIQVLPPTICLSHNT